MARGETEGGGRRAGGSGGRGGAGKRAATSPSASGADARGGAGKRTASARTGDAPDARTGTGKRTPTSRSAGAADARAGGRKRTTGTRAPGGRAASKRTQPSRLEAEASAPREAPDDALRRLGDRLEAASDAAERLFSQAAGEAAARIHDRVKPPPSGWQTADGPAPAAPPSADVALLLQAVRELVPADLQQRLVEAVRELLLAIRALIDWYLTRLEQRRAEPVQVQDIPVL